MGSCMSSKSKGALADSQNNAPAKLKARLLGSKMEKKNKMYRGSATSFGFKKPAINNKSTLSDIPQAQETLTTDPVETLAALKNGTPRTLRTKQDSNLTQTTVRPNRFGFRGSTPLSNKVSDSQNDSTKANLRLEDSKQPQPIRSHLPRPQFPVRLAAPAGYHPRTASVDKSAKTAANNHTARRSRSENGGSSASSVNGSDSGVGSQKSGGEMEIEQLECSPSARNKYKNKQFPHKSRPMEMVFPKGNQKKFELRDLPGGVEMTEIISLELPPLSLGKRLPQDKELVRERARAYMGLRNGGSNSGSSEDEGVGDDQEEKLHRDRVLSEKDERGTVGAGDEEAEMDGGEDLWGHEEAMAPEEELSTAEDLDSDPDRVAMTAPLRSVLLSIEDHSFAALAAMSTSAMLEDESCPDIPDFPNSLSLTIPSPEASNDQHKLPSDKDKKNDSPGSPGTPTHTSNSLSLSSDLRDKDDFFDDEICDQPGLVYDNLSAGNTLVVDNEDNCPSPAINKTLSLVANLTVDCSSARHSSIGTLSPCESITSDDLIMDFDLSARDDDHRLDMCSLDLALTDGEGEVDGEEGGIGTGEREPCSRQNSTLLSTRPEKERRAGSPV